MCRNLSNTGESANFHCGKLASLLLGLSAKTVVKQTQSGLLSVLRTSAKNRRLLATCHGLMAKKFDLSTDKGVSSLNEHLQNRSYVDGNGYRPTQLDAQLFASLTVELKECAKQVNFYRWYNHIASFSDAERKQ